MVKENIFVYSIIGSLNAAWAFNALGTPLGVPIVWSPYRITPIHWLMARKLPLTYSHRHLTPYTYWRTRYLLLRFLCLNEAAILALLLRYFWPNLFNHFRGFLHLHFGDCISGTLFSSRWSAMEYHRCQPPCACFIASNDPHSKCVKCLGFSHAREAVYGI